jgi:hypothetical protein
VLQRGWFIAQARNSDHAGRRSRGQRSAAAVVTTLIDDGAQGVAPLRRYAELRRAPSA